MIPCVDKCIQNIRISRSYWARKARHGTPHSLFLGFGPWPWCRLKKEDWQPKKERNQRTPGRRRSQEDQLTPASSYSGPGSQLAQQHYMHMHIVFHLSIESLNVLSFPGCDVGRRKKTGSRRRNVLKEHLVAEDRKRIWVIGELVFRARPPTGTTLLFWPLFEECHRMKDGLTSGKKTGCTRSQEEIQGVGHC
jgi:hypothetical protein